jgi:Tfp pilus assembly protein PilF
VLYNPVNRCPFVNYDDDGYVTDNTHIRGISLETIRWAFTTTAEANYHPLTWLSHALDYQLFHLNAAGHHFTSLAFHIANAVLLFLLLARATRRVAASLLAAALFAVHPINVESVAWVAERKNLLSTFFFFLTLWAYGWYVRNPDWRRYVAVAGLFVMGLLSKPMVITLPFVLLLLDYWPLGRIQGRSTEASGPELAVFQPPVRRLSISKLVVEKIPLFVLSAASAWVTMYVQRAGGAVRSGQQFPLGVRLENSIVSYSLYLWKTVWPARLAVLYPHPGSSLKAWQIALGIVVVLGISAIVFRYRSRRYLAVGWLWFLGTLLPVIGLVQVGYQSMADRYAYIPLIGIFIMAVWGVEDLAERWKLRLVWLGFPAAVIVLTLSWGTRRQLAYWDNGFDLWSHALEVNPKNFIAHDNLGDAYLRQGNPDQAFAHFQIAAQIMPRDPWSHANLGAYLQQHGQLPAAIAQYLTTLSLTRDQAMAALTYANLGSAYRDLGDESDSRKSFDAAIAINPNQYNAYFGRAVLLRQQGRLAEAIADFSRSVAIKPTAEGYLRLGQTLAQAGRRDEAGAALQQALSITPDLAEARQAADALRQSK